MPHCIVPAADRILDKSFKVLDKGFVRLVDYMGSDERIVAAARVSYGTGTKTFRQDRGLINYLLKNDHTSPFEQVIFTFHLKMPIFVARQWIRHRTARVNEISGRYSVLKDDFYFPDKKVISLQSSDNKQGRSTDVVPEKLQNKVMKILQRGQKHSYEDYQELIDDEIARELARINLPLSIYTEMYWQIDLHNFFRFLRLRIDPHAQFEIREYAETLLKIGEKVCPIAFEAFRNHIVGAVRFSAVEMDALQALIKNKPVKLDEKQYAEFAKKLKLPVD